MNCVILYHVCVTNEHWYVWFVLIAGHFICLRSWLVTMCDIWPFVGVSNIMNATYGKGPYLPSWAFVSKSSFNGAPVAQTLVSNVNHCLPFVLSLTLSLICVLRYVGSGYTDVVFRLSLCLLGLKLSVFSTDFIFCSYLYSNKITSIQEGAFNNLTSLTYL
jgi:hypothetical protein